MKRTIWLAILLTLLLAVFTACGSKDTPTVDTSSKETSAVVTDPTGNQPAESEAPETDAPETDELETAPVETNLTETAPVETNLTETAPAENNPAETDSAETSPAETDSVETETSHTHAWGDWTTIEEATCTETGMSERTCACGEKETQDIEALGHTEAIDEAVAPTCTETGLTEGKHCSVCHEVLLSQETVDALGHDEIFHEGQNASCTENGWDEYMTCSRCDYTTYAEVPALGHTVFSFVEYEAPVQLYVAVNDETYPFTINGDGIIISTNHDDNSVATYTIIAQRSIKLDFAFAVSSESNYDYLVVEYNGSIFKSVSGSQDWESYYINLSEGDVFSFSYSKDYSSSDGQDCIYIFFFTEPTASVVEELVLATEEILASMQSTCTEDVCCQECDAVLIERLGHTEVIDAAVAPTASETGLTEGKHCSVCNEILVEQEVIPATGSVGLIYELKSAGTGYIVTGIGTCTDSAVCIPEIYQGLPVTEIARRAFYNCATITEITIPKSVTSIGRQCLYKCSNLKTVYYNSNYAPTTDTVFLNIASLEKVVFGGQSVPDNILYDCPYVKEVEILDSVTTIGTSAFYECTGLQTITISNNVSCIPAYILEGCTALAHISAPCVPVVSGNGEETWSHLFDGNVPSSVKKLTITNGTHIIDYAFMSWTSLEEIVFSSNIVSIGEGAFAYCSSLNSVTIPDGVTSIGVYAFYECTSLQNITLPGSVSSIGNGAFYCCSSLESITIPASVEYIGEYAFVDCLNLKNVHYEGTVDQWCNVVIGTAGSPCFNKAALYINGVLVDELIIPRSVTHINREAFSFCTSLVSVTFESNSQLTTLYDNAFLCCPNLTSVILPDGLTFIDYNVFKGCTSLTSVGPVGSGASVEIPDTVTAIGYAMFRDCISLEIVEIPDSIDTISEKAFNGCTALTSITIPDSVNIIGNIAFSGCTALTSISIPDSVTSIGDEAFNGCTALTSISIPDSVNTIGNSAFRGCTSLASIFIDENTASIGENAFSDCTSLSTITFSEDSQLVSIGSEAFSGCTSLTSIDIPLSVTSIGSGAFTNCSNLNSIFTPVLSAANVYYGDFESLFAYDVPKKLETVIIAGNAHMEEGVFRYCSSLINVIILEGVTEIASDAFYGCKSLTNVVIPNSVTTIGESAFSDCTSLTNIIIPNSVTTISNRGFACCYSLKTVTFAAGSSLNTIGESAFIGCELLRSIELPAGVTTIGYQAFANCDSLRSIELPAGLTTIGAAAFQNCTSLTSIEIPASVTQINSGSYSGCFGQCTKLATVIFSEGSQLTAISDGTFVGCSSLTSITIPDNVTTIGDNAFASCKNLASVTFGKDSQLTTIVDFAFYNCKKLAAINFAGTEEQWNAIEKEYYWDHQAGQYTIYYNYEPDDESSQGSGATTTDTRYSIYIDNEYFIDTDDNFRYIVAEKYTYYQLFIKDNETGEILTYGTDGLTCVSADDSMVSVGPSGTMVIHQEGGVSISLVQNGTVLDTIAVHGCVENSRITNYAATKDSELFSNGFAPNNRLKVFNYQSTFVEDSSYEGGGYYKVTFDVYNDVPTYFCVAVFDKNDNLLDQKLIDGYSGGVVSEMVDTFINFGDWFNGNLVSGETEIGQKKTSVEFEVPLGGYVDFLTLNNSYHMVFANTLCGVVIHAMEAGEDWAKLIEVASTDIDVDKVKFGEALVNKIAKNLDLSPDEVIKKIMDLAVDKDDYAAFATSLMTFIWSSEITLEDLFITLAECTKSDLPGLSSEMVNGSIDLALTVIPPAKILKKLADATVSSLQYAIILKDIAYMSTNNSDFLIIVYPTEHIS